MATGGGCSWQGWGRAVSGVTYGKHFDSKTAVWYKIPTSQPKECTRIRLDPEICQLLEEASQQRRGVVSFTDKLTGSYFTAYLETKKLYIRGSIAPQAHLERVEESCIVELKKEEDRTENRALNSAQLPHTPDEHESHPNTTYQTERKSVSWYAIDKKLGERSKLPEEVCQELESAYLNGCSSTIFSCQKTGQKYIAFLGKDNKLYVDTKPYVELERVEESCIVELKKEAERTENRAPDSAQLPHAPDEHESHPNTTKPLEAGKKQRGNRAMSTEKLWQKTPAWKKKDVIICYGKTTCVLFPSNDLDADEAIFFQSLFLGQHSWSKCFLEYLRKKQFSINKENVRILGKSVQHIIVSSKTEHKKFDKYQMLYELVQECGIRVRLLKKNSSECEHILQESSSALIAEHSVSMYRNIQGNKLALIGQEHELKEIMKVYGLELIDGKGYIYGESLEVSSLDVLLFTNLNLSKFLQFDKYNVKCYVSKGIPTLIFVGMSLKQIREAIESTTRFLGKVPCVKFCLQKEKLNLLQQIETKIYVEERLKQKRKNCVICVDDEAVKIFGVTENQIKIAKLEIERCINTHVLPTNIYKKLAEQNLNGGKFKIISNSEDTCFVVCTFDISEQMLEILSRCSAAQFFYSSVSKIEWDFICKHYDETLNRIKENYGVKITAMNNGLQVESENEIKKEELEKEIRQLLPKRKENIPLDPSLEDFVMSEEGRESLRQLAVDNKTIYDIDVGDDGATNACDNLLCGWYFENVSQQILLVQGRAADLHVDCLVIPVNERLVPLTHVEHGIQESFDEEMRKEVVEKSAKLGQHIDCSVWIEGEHKGTLECNKLPVYLRIRNVNRIITHDELCNKLKEIFTKAESLKLESVGFPIEYLEGVSENKITVMLSAVVEAASVFFKHGKGQNFKKVYLCTVKKEDADLKINEVEKTLEETKTYTSKSKIRKVSMIGLDSTQITWTHCYLPVKPSGMTIVLRSNTEDHLQGAKEAIIEKLKMQMTTKPLKIDSCHPSQPNISQAVELKAAGRNTSYDKPNKNLNVLKKTASGMNKGQMESKCHPSQPNISQAVELKAAGRNTSYDKPNKNLNVLKKTASGMNKGQMESKKTQSENDFLKTKVRNMEKDFQQRAAIMKAKHEESQQDLKSSLQEKIEMVEEKLRNTEHKLSVAEEGHGLVAKELGTCKKINAQLTSEIEKTKSDYHCLESKINTMEKDFQQRAAIMKAKHEESKKDLKSSLQEKIESLEEKLRNTEHKLSVAGEYHGQVAKELETYKKNNAQLTSDIEELEKFIIERDRLTSQLKETREKLDTRQTQIVELRGKLKKKLARITALKKKASDMYLIQDELRAKIKFLTEEKIEILEETLRNTEQKLSVAEEGHSLVAKELGTCKKINAQLTSDNEKTKSDYHCLESKVSNMEKDFQQRAAIMKAKHEESKKDLKSSLQEKIESLEEKLRNTENKLSVAGEDHGLVAKELETYKKNNAQLTSDIEELEKFIIERDRLTSQLKETREKLDTRQTQIVELRGKLKKKLARITALKKKASDMYLIQDELRAKIKFLTEEKIEILEETLRNTEQKLSVAEEGHSLVAKELGTCKKINAQLTSDNEKTKSDYHCLESKINTMEKDFQQRAAIMKAKHEESQQDLKSFLQEKIEMVEEKLRNTEQKLSVAEEGHGLVAKELGTCKKINAQLTSEIEKTKSDYHCLESKISTMEKDFQQRAAIMKAKHEESQQDLKSFLQEKIESLEEKLRNTENKLSVAGEDHGLVAKELETYKKNNAQLTSDIEELEKFIIERDRLTSQLKETREKLDTRQTQIVELRGKLKKKLARITALKKKASDMYLIQDELRAKIKFLTEEKIVMLEETLRNTEQKLSVAEEGHSLVAKELGTCKKINAQLTSDNEVYMECKTEVYEDVLNSIKFTYGQNGIDSLVSDLDQFAKVEICEGRVLVLCDYNHAENVQKCVKFHYNQAKQESKTTEEKKHLINGGNNNHMEWLQFAYGHASWSKNLQLEEGKLYMTGTLQMKKEVEKAVHSMNYWYQERLTMSFEEQHKGDDVVELVKNELPTVFINLKKEIMIVMSDNSDNFERAKHKVKAALGRVKITARGRGCRDPQHCGESYSRLSKDDKMDACPKFPKSGFQRDQPTTVLIPRSYYTKEGLTAKVYLGNITSLLVNCIVNAANGFLSHSGGVALAISKAAGEDFDQEGEEYVKKHGPISVTQCCVTSAGRLPYKLVIHAVGPIWSDYKDNESERCMDDLKKTIVSCLIKANKFKITSIAIPPVSSGIFGVPKELCAQMYAKGVIEYSKTYGLQSVKEIHFVDINSKMCQLIQSAFDIELQCT